MKVNSVAFLLLIVASSAGALTFTKEQLQTPVGVIYHYGERKVLMDDAALDTIPKPAWDKYVMGDSASWSQQPFRRGLYGCANGGQTEFYADAAAQPWMIGIRIKPECLRSETVAHIPELYRRADFKNWFAGLGSKSGFVSWNDLLKKCFVRGDGHDFVGFNFNNDTKLYTVCGKIADRFLNEKQVSVVYDDRIEGCWYIRRRECIEKIDGSPDEVVDMLARIPARIQESYSGEHGPQEVTLDLSRNSRVMFHIFASSMAEATAADPVHVEQIARSAQGTVGLETELSEMDMGERPRFWLTWDMRALIPTLAKAYTQCARTPAAAKSYRAALAAFLQAWEPLFASPWNEEKDKKTQALVQGPLAKSLRDLCAQQGQAAALTANDFRLRDMDLGTLVGPDAPAVPEIAH